MARRAITVELDEETLRCLAVLGEPHEVLARVAGSAAEGVRRPDAERRAQTDQSLQVERDKADVAIATDREVQEQEADEGLRVARERADEITPAGDLLEAERRAADVALGRARAQRRSSPGSVLTREREATDQDLVGERAQADSLIVDQRDVNEQLVRATLRAQELAVEAEEARQRAEASERELREVAEFREMFIGILGHDLRSPLAAIVNAGALLLRRGRLDEQDSAAAARILRSSERMRRMILQVLDLTRARLGDGLTIETEPTDLGEICRDVATEFEAPITLAVEGDVAGAWDPDRVAEALSNLVGNAVEHALQGTAVSVTVRGEADAVVVEVKNDGAPIPDEVLPFIFEPFRRARQREKSPTGNLGLGLYIAHQIVLSHGGTLAARSADGTTTFTMRLPRSGVAAREG